MNRQPISAKIIVATISIVYFCLPSNFLFAYTASDFNWRPPFTITNSATPSITLLLDSSESMHRMAYAWQSEKTSWNDAYEKYGEPYNSLKLSIY